MFFFFFFSWALLFPSASNLVFFFFQIDFLVLFPICLCPFSCECIVSNAVVGMRRQLTFIASKHWNPILLFDSLRRPSPAFFRFQQLSRPFRFDRTAVCTLRSTSSKIKEANERNPGFSYRMCTCTSCIEKENNNSREGEREREM